MQLNVRKWGNSLALRLPRHVTDQSRLHDGSCVEIEFREDGAMIIKPVRPKFKLSDLLSNEKPKQSAEVDWGEPKGDEVW
jgi:antitoxin MazE